MTDKGLRLLGRFQSASAQCNEDRVCPTSSAPSAGQASVRGAQPSALGGSSGGPQPSTCRNDQIATVEMFWRDGKCVNMRERHAPCL